jgi:hypothetical protein
MWWHMPVSQLYEAQVGGSWFEASLGQKSQDYLKNN